MTERIVNILRKTVIDQVDFTVTAPERQEFGHYSTNIALRLAAKLGKNPQTLAAELVEQLRKSDTHSFFEKIEAIHGFINFWLSAKALKQGFLKIKKAGPRWGRPRTKSGVIVIDYSHPNIAKPMSIAHLRSTIIGQALYNVFKFSGWRTIGDNHLGDWGKQFGILIAAYKAARLKTKKIHMDKLLELYIGYTEKMKTEPDLKKRARQETKKLQRGDHQNIRIWKQFYKISLNELKKVYKFLEVSFDYYLGESFYKDMLAGIVAEALRKGVAQRSKGAVIIPFKEMSPAIIQTGDETFLYATTDLATIKYRLKRFKPQIILYVVDNGQSLHFKQVFTAAKKLEFISKESLVHVKFGLILSEDFKKLSTRAGRYIALEEVIEQAIRRAEQIVDLKRPDLKTKERKKIAITIGIAALKYNDLSQNRLSDITFNWDKMLNLEGNSAPYLMYTYARLKSILRKAKPGPLDVKYLESHGEFELILKLLQFPVVIDRIIDDYFPHHLADYLYSLAQSANVFYHTEPVLKAAPGSRAIRLHLVAQVATTLKTGLNLLGIKTLEVM